MIQQIKGAGSSEPDIQRLGKQLLTIWSTLGQKAVFTVGIRKTGEVDIITLEALQEMPKLKETSDKSNGNPEYIG